MLSRTGAVSEATLSSTDNTANFQLELYYLQRRLKSLNDVDFSTSPDRVETASELNHVNGAGFLGLYKTNKAFAVRVSGDLFVETAGEYTLYVTSGDTAIFTIDGASGRKITTQVETASSVETAVTVYLDSGYHALDIRYFEHSEEPILGLEWQGPDTGGERSFLTSEDLADSSALLEQPADNEPTPVKSEPATSEATDEPESDLGTSEPPAEADSSGLFVPTPAFGSDNPTVSFNLNGVTDYSTQMPFLDIAKTMRPWIGHEAGKWGGMSLEDLEAGGYLDANGWVTEIPEGLDSVGSTWAWNGQDAVESRAGVYVLTYEGEGEIQIQGHVQVLAQEPGQIVFENPTGGSMSFKITETDPSGTGEYIRDISVVREDHLSLYEAGAIFNPDWVDLISDSREFRFMDWMETNNSDIKSWDDRPQTSSATWSEGVPVEVMVQLANEAGVDPWFNMPHMADDEYVRQFAEYVRDNLDPNLTARVEYSNEIWNFAFEQTHWMKEQAASEWGDTSGAAYLDYQIMRATQVGLIWEDVFSQVVEAPALINVLGVQTVNEWSAERLLTGSVWQASDPDGFVDPATVFDELAVTTYFGSKIVAQETTRLELIAAIEDPKVDENAWLTEKLMDPDQRSSIPDILNELQQMKAVADKYGLDMVAYEGGQHVHHSFAVGGLTTEQVDALTQFFTDYVRSPDMAMLYEELWSVWAQVSDGAFMQFGDVGTPGKYGSWAILSDLDDTNPRADFLFDQMENATPWWDAQSNAAYLQGVTRTGTDAADVMIGTDEEDYLTGSGGNDKFIVGGGNDGINGGDGVDSLLLEGAPEDYAIRVQGDGHLISGPRGDKFVINVESFVFQNGTTLVLDELIELLPETLPTPEPDPVDDPVDDPDPMPGDQTQSSPVELNLNGQLHDNRGEFEAVVAVETADATSVRIDGVNKWSSLGKELGLETNAAYVVHENGSSIEVENADGAVETVVANYWSLQQNSTGKDGAQISGSAVETALRFGDVVIDPTAIHATNGNDTFLGREFDDTVFGEDGRDYLAGGAGDDNLHGGKGRDTLVGGTGADKFYLTAGDGQDRIKDFDIEDMLILTDYLDVGDTLADAAMLNDDGNLVLSNGVDQVVLDGLDLDDLGWIQLA